MDLSHGPARVFGLLAFLGLFLLAYGYLNERGRRRAPSSTRPTISGSVQAAGKRQMFLGGVALVVGSAGLLVLWVIS